ncbi:hypothetical protein [Streptomyces cavernicola]|uniref:Uncharacterized protein n=1 Tax=Streptomyces cavernicola TaxID=3043613 RepID=A0ABT6S481_9ACTN|nr:hypothetical protein [Streptomyces sp. B-S-A6]MDI3402902.1 hypothetical protein [Streptomyces sp. B-S-A6]
MALIAEYEEYLQEFRAEVVDGLSVELAGRGATLRELTFSEDEDGVWAESVLDLPDRREAWVRRRLVVPSLGPDKDAWLAGVVYASAVGEELDLNR